MKDDYKLEKSKITYITLKVTNRCNMKCYMCGQTKVRDELSKEDLSFELIKKRLDELDSIQTVYIFGGEPLLYKELSKILAYLKERNIDVLMTTNGVLVDKYAEDLVRNRIRDLTFSVDSLNTEKYAEIRGSDTYHLVLNNLRKIIEVKKKMKSEYPHLGVNCVILPENKEELKIIYNYFDEEFPEVKRVNFESLIGITAQIGKQYEGIMKTEFGCTGEAWKWFYEDKTMFNAKDKEIINKQLAEIRNNERVTLMVGEENEKKNETKVCGRQICDFPNYSLTVLPNGDVTFCTDFPDYIVGNIYDSSFEEIFCGEKAVRFRRYLHEKGGLPICADCPRQHCEKDFFIKS